MNTARWSCINPKGCVGRTGLACFPIREFLPGANELKIAEIAGAAFYIRHDDLGDLKTKQIVVDAGPGSGGTVRLGTTVGVRFFCALAPGCAIAWSSGVA
jgi:uncharacterized protein (DUF779 family)